MWKSLDKIQLDCPMRSISTTSMMFPCPFSVLELAQYFVSFHLNAFTKLLGVTRWNIDTSIHWISDRNSIKWLHFKWIENKRSEIFQQMFYGDLHLQSQWSTHIHFRFGWFFAFSILSSSFFSFVVVYDFVVMKCYVKSFILF